MSERSLLDRVVATIGGRRLGLTGSAVGTLGTNLGGTALRFVTQVVLARVLGSADYGLFVLGRGWGELLSKIPDGGYNLAAVRVLSEEAERGRWDRFHGFVAVASRETVRWASVLVVVACVAYWALGNDLNLTIVVGMTLAVPLSLTTLSRAFLQGADQYVLAITVTEIVQPLLFAGALAVLWLTVGLSALGVLAIYVASYVAVAVTERFLLRRAAVPSTTEPDESSRREWRRLGLRFYTGQLAIAVLGVADVLIVGELLGEAEAGLYGVASRIAVVGRLVNSGLERVVSPRISAAYARDAISEIQAAVDGTIRVSALPTLGFAVLAVVFAEPLLSVFGDEFVAASTVLWLLLIGNVSNALTGPSGFVVSLTGQEREYSAVMAVHAIGLVLLAIGLAGPAGLAGVAAAQSAITVSWNITLVVMARRRLGVACYPRIATLRRRTD